MAPDRIERPIILLDLNATLSSNYAEVRAAARESSFAEAVTAVEQYRQWLVDWLKQSGFEVFLFTARPAQLERVTLTPTSASALGALQSRPTCPPSSRCSAASRSSRC